MHTLIFWSWCDDNGVLTARISPLHLCEFVAIVMPNRGKGGGKPAEDEEPTGTDRRLPREPLGPYDRPCPIDGDPWDRRMWAQDLRKGKSKGRTIPAGLLEIMQDQLPMLTEKGLQANGAFPPESLIEIVRSHGSKGAGRGGGARGARDAEEEDFVEEDEYRIPPGEGDRYWDEHGVEQFYD